MIAQLTSHPIVLAAVLGLVVVTLASAGGLYSWLRIHFRHL